MTIPAPRSIHVAVLALGGQGGGVLVDWIADLAEQSGWTAQSTSVAGVAQRTGATVYYLELVEPTPGREPVMALMPVPGQVDVLIAAELMEAGRGLERGFVTPDRTMVVTSSHRTYAVQEKVVPGNGVADSAEVLARVRREARRLVAADMQAIAVEHRSVISASLFGALAGSGALPFRQDDFESVIRRSGVGVESSLAALRAAADKVRTAEPLKTTPDDAMATPPRALPMHAEGMALEPLLDRIRREYPAAAHAWLGEGLARVVDWQDAAYGSEYLDRVASLAARDDAGQGYKLTIEAARWIAVAMCYDDMIRVADLKTRAERSARIRGELAAKVGEVIGCEEYFHPRIEEILGVLPRGVAERINETPRLRNWLSRRIDRSRRVRTHTVRGHLMLRAVAQLRRTRRGSHRHALEQAHLRAWLDMVARILAQDYLLAVEVLRCRRLVKGYSDTHARGQSRFDLLMRAAESLIGQPDAGQALARLREAALRDAEGGALEAALTALQIDAIPSAHGIRKPVGSAPVHA